MCSPEILGLSYFLEIPGKHNFRPLYVRVLPLHPQWLLKKTVLFKVNLSQHNSFIDTQLPLYAALTLDQELDQKMERVTDLPSTKTVCTTCMCVQAQLQPSVCLISDSHLHSGHL